MTTALRIAKTRFFVIQPAQPNPQTSSTSCLFEDDSDDDEFVGFMNDLTHHRGGGNQ